jgi:cytidylate kinase
MKNKEATMTTTTTEGVRYIPGTYARQRPDASQIAGQYIRDWEARRRKLKGKATDDAALTPTICFSRKIGSGALEVADRLAEKINWQVVDRELLDHIARDKQINTETAAFFDERYPGKMVELSALLFGEKSFIMSDYLRNIIAAVYTFSDMGNTIFVGRGIHLILPRDRVLAARIICSDDYRIHRLAEMLDLDEDAAGRTLKQVDREQKNFFKKAFGKKDAPPAEFDLVLNCDYLYDPEWIAAVVATAFEKRFGQELQF